MKEQISSVISPWLSYLDACQILEQGDDSGMIQSAPSVNPQRGEELFDKCRRRNRSTDRSSSIVNEIQVLEMQVDLESRRKIAGQDFFGFLIQTFASCKTACEGTNHFLRIDTGLGSEDQRLTYRGQIYRDDDLIRQLRKASTSQRSHVGDGLSQGLKQR